MDSRLVIPYELYKLAAKLIDKLWKTIKGA